MDIKPLTIDEAFDSAIRKIDSMRRIASRKQLWVVVADRPPVPVEDQAEIEQHNGEVNALLHYARIGLLASNGKLKRE